MAGLIHRVAGEEYIMPQRLDSICGVAVLKTTICLPPSGPPPPPLKRQQTRPTAHTASTTATPRHATTQRVGDNPRTRITRIPPLEVGLWLYIYLYIYISIYTHLHICIYIIPGPEVGLV